MAETSNLLELSTTIERRKIAVDGIQYELRHKDEFTLGAQCRLAACASDCERIDKILTLTPAEADQVATSIKIVVTEMIIADNAASVVEKLTDVQRVAIMRHFLGMRPQQMMPAQPTAAKMRAKRLKKDK